MKRLLVLVAAACAAGDRRRRRRPPRRRPPPSSSTAADQIATQVCAACHGADGNSATPANPNLAGQHADYITLQLAHFKAGIRVNPIMQGMAAPLSDADMRALGLYFSQQKPKGLAAKDASLVKAGTDALARRRRGRPACPPARRATRRTAPGIPKNYPRLAGQYADYTYAQLKAFKAGERGRDKDGKDVQRRVMHGVGRAT